MQSKKIELIPAFLGNHGISEEFSVTSKSPASDPMAALPVSKAIGEEFGSLNADLIDVRKNSISEVYGWKRSPKCLNMFEKMEIPG